MTRVKKSIPREISGVHEIKTKEKSGMNALRTRILSERGAELGE